MKSNYCSSLNCQFTLDNGSLFECNRKLTFVNCLDIKAS